MSHFVLDLDRYIPFLLTATANKLSTGASRVYREKFDIGITDWRILAMLAVEPNITAARICTVIGLDKAATSRALLNLRKRGFVQESKHHNTDKRSTVIQLTDSGKNVHDEIMKVALMREQKLLEAFSESEAEQLVDYFQRLHRQVEKVNLLTYENETIEHYVPTLDSPKQHTKKVD
ncbi:MarR family winged helix-turn-helix transcriptional regulator [Saccharospirillum alexandrii]|uniref:MarR family winged helix-turn-helix transcriptional regulator n=1 Tax=Saccharospirillum alexandrii TaxID=2448477 RepID=UPI000FD9C8F0|nr:MarR family transcriptional regulator [Saccharospirillum alexandrii]